MGRKLALGAGCSLCCLVVLWAVLTGAVVYIGRGQITSINRDWGQPLAREDGTEQTPANMATYEWWPGCDRKAKSEADFDECGKDCFDHELPFAVDKFNKEHDFKLIEGIPSRRHEGIEDASLTAWWLPVEDANAPVVVLFHGMSSSFNAMKVQVPAYYLRKMGISVLLPNLRSHGSSSNSTHGRISWALEYPYDVLGAWDYVVTDPDGKLGGERAPERVGLAGGSLGGLVSASAFGMEERIPGLWLNGAIFDPKIDLLGKAVGFLGPLAPLVYEPSWQLICASTGLHLRKELPHDHIMTSGASAQEGGLRKVAVVQSPDDSATPQSAHDGYVELFQSKASDRYELVLDWQPKGLCNGDIHVFESIKWPVEYQRHACEFWGQVFTNSTFECTETATPSSHQEVVQEEEEEE